MRILDLVTITVQDREDSTEAQELADHEPPVIGKVPLIQPDGVVDPVEKTLTGNPEHGGAWIFDVFHQETCVTALPGGSS